MTRAAEFVTVDRGGTELAGLHYPPADPDAGVAVLHLHGKGGNFYTGPGRRVPLRAEAGRVGHLALNMRCHDLGYTDYEVPMGDARSGAVDVAGGMWEDLDAGSADIRAGVGWLVDRGYERVVLSGHSSGGFYVAQFCADAVDPGGERVAARVFLSPVLSHRPHLHGGWFREPGGLERALDRARTYVEAGEGHRLIEVDYWYHAISARSLLQRFEEPPDRFASLLAASDLPMLMVCGGAESRVAAWRDLVEGSRTREKEFLVLDGADHNYIGSERPLADRITSFARRVGR